MFKGVQCLRLPDNGGNSFQIVGAIKLKERLLKLVVQKGIDKRF